MGHKATGSDGSVKARLAEGGWNPPPLVAQGTQAHLAAVRRNRPVPRPQTVNQLHCLQAEPRADHQRQIPRDLERGAEGDRGSLEVDTHHANTGPIFPRWDRLSGDGLRCQFQQSDPNAKLHGRAGLHRRMEDNPMHR